MSRDPHTPPRTTRRRASTAAGKRRNAISEHHAVDHHVAGGGNCDCSAPTATRSRAAAPRVIPSAAPEFRWRIRRSVRASPCWTCVSTAAAVPASDSVLHNSVGDNLRTRARSCLSSVPLSCSIDFGTDQRSRSPLNTHVT